MNTQRTSTASPRRPPGDPLDLVELESAVLVRHFEMLRRRTDVYREVERAEYLLLRSLDGEGPTDICGLAARLGLDPSTAGRQVHGLSERGLVARTPAPEDRRRSVVTLSPAGRRVMRRVQSRRRDETASLLADWSADDVRELGEALTRYNAAVAERYLG
jgi:DNA-binding MarR family transcriptional regulator